jgi:cytochrome c oxidase subunit 4
MSDHTSHDDHPHHITSLAVLIATFVALVALTVLTSVLAQVNLGRADIWITLGIATVKAAMVAAIFMHLIHDKAFNGIILMATLLFVALFVGFTLMDSEQYAPAIKAYSEVIEQKDYVAAEQQKAQELAAAAAEATPETAPDEPAH